jgi:hypothetical protein
VCVKGTWGIALNLQPGKYQYLFHVDGEWREDPKAKERVENPFGGYNSVRTVG